MYGYSRRTSAGPLPAPAAGWPVLLVVLVVFSCGLLFGSVSSSRIDQAKSEDLKSYVGEMVRNAGGVSFDSSRMARGAMVNNMITVAAIYVLGLTVIGMPVTLAILFVKGFVMGFAVCFLTRDLSLGGVLLTAAAVLPHNLLYIPSICVGAASSLMFSILLLKRNFNTAVRILPGLVSYTAVMLVVLLAMLGAGLVEGYVTPAFTRMAAGAVSSWLAK